MNTLPAIVLLAAAAAPVRALAQSTEQTLPPIAATLQPPRPAGMVAVGIDVEGPRLVLALPVSNGGYRDTCLLPCTSFAFPGPLAFAMRGPGIDWTGVAEVPPSGARIHVRRAVTAGIVGGIGLIATGSVLTAGTALFTTVILLFLHIGPGSPDPIAVGGIGAIALSASVVAAGIVLYARSTPRTRVEAATAPPLSEHAGLDPASAGVSLVRATVARF